MNTVRFLHDPTCDPVLHDAVSRLHDPEGGTVVVAGIPGTRASPWVYTQTLEAMGKSLMEYEHSRAFSDAEGFAVGWLAVEGVRRLVLVGATLMGKYAASLCLRALALGIDVVMFDDSDMTDHFRAHVSGLSGGVPKTLTVESFGSEFDWERPQPDPVPRPAQPWGDPWPRVPRSGFLTFRADMRRLLTAEAFDAADGVYRAAFEQAMGHDLSAVETAGPELHSALTCTTDRSVQIVTVRAYQAAAFRQGCHLTVDLDRVLDAVAPAACIANLAPDQWASLYGWVRPFFPVVVALAGAGVRSGRCTCCRRPPLRSTGPRSPARGWRCRSRKVGGRRCAPST